MARPNFQVKMESEDRLKVAQNILGQFQGNTKTEQFEALLEGASWYLAEKDKSVFRSNISTIETSLNNILTAHNAIISAAEEMVTAARSEHQDLLKSKDKMLLDLQTELKTTNEELAKVIDECETAKAQASEAIKARKLAEERESAALAAYRDRQELIDRLRDENASLLQSLQEALANNSHELAE